MANTYTDPTARQPHRLRRLSNALHALAMVLPLPLARPVARLASRFFYA